MPLVLPSVLCPVDFSEPSRSALAYSAAIADHFGARLTVLSVDDPLLTEVAASTGQIPSLADVTLQELERFCRETLTNYETGPKKVEFRKELPKSILGKTLHRVLRADEDAQLRLRAANGCDPLGANPAGETVAGCKGAQ